MMSGLSTALVFLAVVSDAPAPAPGPGPVIPAPTTPVTPTVAPEFDAPATVAEPTPAPPEPSPAPTSADPAAPTSAELAEPSGAAGYGDGDAFSETLPEPTPPPIPSTVAPVGAAAQTAPPTTPPPVGDLGGQAVAPLPRPPPPLDPAKMRHQPWRGRWWMAFRVSVGGPLAGERPARPTVLSLGAGADVGWRIGNVLGLGMGLSGHVHNRLLLDSGSRIVSGRMLYWDALFARIHVPVWRRIQPYAEIGGGLARLTRPELEDVRFSAGPQMRGALGLEGWVSPNITLGFSTVYRLQALRDTNQAWTLGHAMHGVFEVGLHW